MESTFRKIGWTPTSGRVTAFARFANDAAGLGELRVFCRGHRVELAVMEATGGYERLAFLWLWEKGLPCGTSILRTARRFAEAKATFDKTDRIDAAVIAHYVAVKQIARRCRPVPRSSD